VLELLETGIERREGVQRAACVPEDTLPAGEPPHQAELLRQPSSNGASPAGW